MGWIKGILKKAIDSGLPLPHAYDPAAKGPSFRLLTAYISFVVAVSSVVALHVWSSLLAATCTAIAFFGLNMIFYMLKKLTSAKIDLNDQELSLNAEPEPAEKTENPQKNIDNPDA